MLQEGCNVAVFDRDMVAASETISIAGASGERARAYAVDVTDYAAVAEAAVAAERDFGPIAVLVNNAGWDQASPFLQTTPEFWQKVVAINYIGVLNLHHAVLPGMVKRGAGKVINIASDAGRVGSSGEAVYAGCKGAVIAFGKTMARECARSNVLINTVCPGPTDTPGFRAFAGGGEGAAKIVDGLSRAIPLRRLGEPDDYPGIVAFLASDDANFITGQVISVSGGLTMHG
jgi:2-hydroxycyclohexanecarboxyl-CoA dehydrogenase